MTTTKKVKVENEPKVSKKTKKEEKGFGKYGPPTFFLLNVVHKDKQNAIV